MVGRLVAFRINSRKLELSLSASIQYLAEMTSEPANCQFLSFDDYAVHGS